LVDNAENVKVLGRGVIDGDGKNIRDQGKPANLIRIRNSKNVLFEGLILRDPAAWNTHILYSENVTFRNIKMINDRTVKNTDGINPDASKHVIIDDCFLYCSDDNIAVKTSRNSGLLQNAEDILVKNCVFLTKKSAMKLGTETFAEYQRNITFENNEVVEADRAMSLYCMDGAKFEDIRWINCCVESFFLDNQQKIMHFRVRDRNGESAGHIKNVLIKDCRFEKRSPEDPLFTGWNEDHQISDVHFENLVIDDKPCKSIEDIGLKTNEFVTNVTISAE
jgi:polygalacturonase